MRAALSGPRKKHLRDVGIVRGGLFDDICSVCLFVIACPVLQGPA